MKYQTQVVIVLGFFLMSSLSAQIPFSPNKTDAQSKRQGAWTIIYDRSWKPISDTTVAVYYRVVNYLDDLPQGEVKDFYRNGRQQFSANMIEDRPKEILHGRVIWFNRRGVKEAEANFNMGKITPPLTLYYTDGSVVSDNWQTLNNQGLTLYKEGKVKEALPFFEKALIRAKREFAKTDKSNSEALTNLFIVYKSLNLFEDAIPIIQEIIDRYAQAEGKENIGYAQLLNALAQIYLYNVEDFKSALPICQEVLDAAARTTGKQTDFYAMAIGNMGILHLRLKNYSQAESALLEAKTTYQKLQGKDNPQNITFASLLISLYFETGDYEKEGIYLNELLDAQAKNKQQKPQEYIETLTRTGTYYLKIGNYQKAESYLKMAEQFSIKTLGKENENYFSILFQLGNLYGTLENFAKAEQTFLEAKDLIVKTQGKHNQQYATALNNLANLFSDRGDYPTAISFLNESKDIYEKYLGKDDNVYAVICNNLGENYRNLRDYKAAEKNLKEATDRKRRQFGSRHPNYAVSLVNLSLLYRDLEKFSKADSVALVVKEIFAKALGKEHPLYITALGNLAAISDDLENYSKCQTYALEAMNLSAATFGKESSQYSNCILNLGISYFDQGDNDKAEPYYLEALSITQKKMIENFPSLSEAERKTFYALNNQVFNSFERFSLSRYPQNPRILGSWYDLRLATKGILLNTSNKVRQRIMNSGNRSLIELYNQWQSKTNFLAKAYQMSITEKQKKGIDENKLEEEIKAMEKKLSLEAELFSSITDNKKYSWLDIQKKLKPGESAIEVIRAARKTGKNKGKVVYVFLIVTPESRNQPDVVVIENGLEMESKFSKYYTNAVKQKLTDEVSYKQYWKPVADKLKGAKKVYFSPDGVYNQINLNTFYNPATAKYLIDEIEVQVMTSTKDIIMSQKIGIEIKDVTLFGYPNYNSAKSESPDNSRALNFASIKTKELKADSAQRFFNGENINELPGTKVEVENIQGLLKRSNKLSHEYLFDRATESEIKRLRNPQVLHIATHGFFLSDLVASNESGFAGMKSKKIIENPLLRSGLLFTGAKNAFDETKRNESEEDGILTAYEAMSLDLDQTDLVVMSACETGLGVSSNGEGVYGLQRAFQVAGAKSVLMSLWTVSDEATQQLMTIFYENWLGGKTPKEAFRMAQLALRTKYPEPYYWGAFVMVGN